MNIDKKIEEETQEDWEEIWKPLLYTNGKLDIKKIEKEMHDLIFVFEQVGKVYSSLTGGTLSKPMYYAEGIIQLHEDAITEAYDEGYADAKEELSQLLQESGEVEYERGVAHGKLQEALLQEEPIPETYISDTTEYPTNKEKK